MAKTTLTRRTSNAPGVYRNKVATEEFVGETVAGMRYLEGICPEIGMAVE